MKNNLIIETIGSVLKEEMLASIETNIYPNTCVIEAVEPFVGYYGSHPEEVTPKHIFFVLKDEVDLEKIIRTTQIIKKNFDVNFDACLANVSMYNSEFQAIRIKDVDGYDKIREIQEHFVFEGIKMKSKKRNVNEKGLIKVEKSFLLQAIENQIYLDEIDREMAYFIIPSKLNWKSFEGITKKVKNNWSGKQFDAALASFIRTSGMIDAIRIYTKDNNEKFLKSIRDLYLKVILEKN